MIRVVLRREHGMESPAAETAVAVIHREVVNQHLTIAPAALHQHVHAVEEFGEAVRQEAVVIVERR